MTLKVSWNHNLVIAMIWVVAMVLMTLANCLSFMRTGSVSGVDTALSGALVVGAAWHVRKL